MDNKQLKLIYEYMKEAGWNHYINPEYLNSNHAWEVVQKMERKGDYVSFFEFAKRQVNFVVASVDFSFYLWLMNPKNFFNCFAKWLEDKEEKT